MNTERCEKDYKKIFLFINNNWRFFLLFSQYYGRYQIFCNGSKALLFASSIMYSVYFPNSLTAGRVTPLSSNPITGKEKKEEKKVIPCRCSFCVCSEGKVGAPKAIPHPDPLLSSPLRVGGGSPPFSMRCVHWAALPRGEEVSRPGYAKGTDCAHCNFDEPGERGTRIHLRQWKSLQSATYNRGAGNVEYRNRWQRSGIFRTKRNIAL